MCQNRKISVSSRTHHLQSIMIINDISTNKKNVATYIYSVNFIKPIRKTNL